MERGGIRGLRQNASCPVADAASGKEVVVTDRGRPAAPMKAVPTSPLQALLEAGLARQARHPITELPAPLDGEDLSSALTDLRDAERY